MRSPFKFLDAFTLADKHAFFGRDKEIEALYDMVFKSPLILVYGLSGTGKTSLIQCGLAGKFDGPDWYPIFIRRQGDFRKSIKDTMDEATKGHSGESLVDSVKYLFSYYLRPVYLIFDQFEEIFTVDPNAEEQIEFREEIQALIDAELPCKIMLIMREEYIGQLYEMEKYIPTLFDFRLRVEPMNIAKVKEVMQSSFQKFNISLEGDDNERLQQMADNISAGKSGVQLPYLQVYLDMLYREDYVRTYGEEGSQEELPLLNFTADEIDKFGQIDDVLEKFLEEQVGSLRAELEGNNQFVDTPENAVRNILDAFVTEEGTKRPIYYERDEYIKLSGPAEVMLASIPTNTLTWVLDSLETRRILRFSKDQIELAHDSLAAKIDEKRTDEQRQLNEILRRLKNNYVEHQQTGEFLSRKQLNAYEDFIPKLGLEPHMLEYIQSSLSNADFLENEERRKQEEKLRLTEEKLAAETRAKKRQRILSAVIGLFGVAALGLGIYTGIQAENIKRGVFFGAINNGHQSITAGQYEAAIFHLDKAKEFQQNIFFSKDELSDTVTVLEGRWNKLADLVPSADSMRLEGEHLWLSSLANYKAASQLTDAVLITERISSLEEDIESKFNTYKNSATMIWKFAGCGPEACSVYKKAKQLKPEDPDLLREMNKCKCDG
ncbi:MAG: ATP-binding protein [Bacteroidota bacterium]